jgi:uncharacterized protein with NRDE domain
MCLIIFAYKALPELSLVVAANRDELFTRSTRQAGFWSDSGANGDILAGRDLEAGGTWLGVTRQGRFAAVTNIRDPLKKEAKSRSRGELTRNFLSSSLSSKAYCDLLKPDFDSYAGFNLLVGDGESLWYMNNFEHLCQELLPGVYGLSNGILNSPWPKVLNGKSQLVQLLSDPENLTTDSLIQMMQDTAQAPDHLLPNTGVPLELERTLSPAFISNPQRHYGTLCSTAVVLNSSNANYFSEQNYAETGPPLERHFYQF